MPASYRIYPRYIRVTLEGVLTDEMVISAQRRMFKDPLYVPTLPRFIDGTGITKLELTPAGVRMVAKEASERGLRLAALLANSEITYAMMRLYEGYACEVDCHVTRDPEEALRFLDIID